MIDIPESFSTDVSGENKLYLIISECTNFERTEFTIQNYYDYYRYIKIKIKLKKRRKM